MTIPKIEAAEAMRRLTDEQRDESIGASRNVLDGMARFEERRKQVDLSQAYRSPKKP